MAFAYKRVLFHSLESGSIFSAAGEVVVPTGDRDRGLGDGVTVLEPFVAFGQILRETAFCTSRRVSSSLRAENSGGKSFGVRRSEPPSPNMVSAAPGPP